MTDVLTAIDDALETGSRRTPIRSCASFRSSA